MNIKSKTKKALPYSVGISLLKMLVALFGMVLLIRYLNAEQYSVYALLAGLPMLLNIFLSMGYDQYLLRYLPKLQDKKEIGEMVWNIIFWRMLTVIGASLLLVLTFPLYADKFGLDGYYLHFAIYQVGILGSIGHLFFEKVFNSRFQQKILMFARTFYEISRFGVILIGIQLEKELVFFVIGLAVSEVGFMLILSVVFLKSYGLVSLLSVVKVRRENKEEKNYRWGSYFEKFGASFLGTDIDRYLLAYFSTNVQVAIYAVATKTLTKLLTFYPNRMFNLVSEAALFSKYDQNENDKDLNKIFSFLYNANNIVAFLFLALFISQGREMLDFVFENDYVKQAYWPLVIFLCFLIFYSVPLTLIARAIKRPKILVYSKLSFIINIAIGIPLAQNYGATGMALATSGSVVIQNAIVYILINQTNKLYIPWMSTIKCMVISATTIAVLELSGGLVDSLFVNLTIGVLVYLFLFKITRILNEYEAKLFLSLVPKKLVGVASFFIK